MRRSAAFLIALALLACGARSGLPGADEASHAGGSGAGNGGEGGDGGGGGGVGGVEQLGLGAQHSCLRTFDGSVYCWGRNGRGQLGVGGITDSLTPVRVKLPAPAVYLASGTYHSCAIDMTGALLCWGANESGQLGDGTTSDSAKPVVALLPEFSGLPEQVAIGEKHSCAVTRDVATGEGQLWCWGSNEAGQIGPGDGTTVPALLAEGVDEVGTGQFHTCWLEAGSLPFCVGDNTQYQCGVDRPQEVFVPVVPIFLERAIPNIRSGGYHNCTFGEGVSPHDQRSTVVCWGSNDSGQLGNQYDDGDGDIELPGVEDVRPGIYHSCALVSGEVECWGDNGSGQLGTAGPSDFVPRPVPGMTGILSIGSGTLHTCAYRSAEEIYCWGSNDFGQLGDGTQNSSFAPVLVKLP